VIDRLVGLKPSQGTKLDDTSRISKLNWNDDYGDWQGLASYEDQRPRYQAIARIIREFHPEGSVLDVGCGEGILANYLSPAVRYTGIEPSAKALAAVSASKITCHHTTAEEFQSGEERWDIIIFNEMLYYSSDPEALLMKFANLLWPNGIIINSIYQKRNSWRTCLKFFFINRMSNARCTRIVKAFITGENWIIEKEQTISQLNREPWWLITVCPPSLASMANIKEMVTLAAV
jgi:2-polyprenyl-3-methyl-5-hydroxy-6-metoxy-1,4-benzoquinol methylase